MGGGAIMHYGGSGRLAQALGPMSLRNEIRCVICAEHGTDALFVAGPSITVCSKCVLSAVSLLLSGNLSAADQMPTSARQSPPHCTFCGKLASEISGLIGYGGEALCPECLGKSVELMAVQAFARSAPRTLLAIPPHGP